MSLKKTIREVLSSVLEGKLISDDSIEPTKRRKTLHSILDKGFSEDSINWNPLYKFLKEIFGEKYMEAADGFMYYETVRFFDKINLSLFRHGITRKYFWLDDDGHPYEVKQEWNRELQDSIPQFAKEITKEEAFKYIYSDLIRYVGEACKSGNCEVPKDIYLMSYSDYKDLRDDMLKKAGYNVVTISKQDDIEDLRGSAENLDERKKKKKRKNNPYILRRPSFNLYYMDAAVSGGDMGGGDSGGGISEGRHMVVGTGGLFRETPRIFDHLKWSLNDEQKQFLYDFINSREDTLKESDWEYASKITGIPAKSIKSIRNTYGEVDKKVNDIIENGYVAKGEGMPSDSRYSANHAGIPATEYDLPMGYRDDVVNFKTVSKEEADAMRFPRKTLRQKEYESGLKSLIGGDYTKVHEIASDKNLDEWARYYIAGKLKPKETRVKDRILEIDFEPSESYYNFEKSMLASNKKSPFWFEVENVLEEFNKVFGMNYKVKEQYDLTNSKSKCVRIVLKNENFNGKQIWDDEAQCYVSYENASERLREKFENGNNLPMGETKIVDHDQLIQDFKDLKSLNDISDDTGWLFGPIEW